MPEIKIQLEDNKDLIKALEGRTKLLEKILSQKGITVADVSKMINKSRSSDLKSFNKMTSTLTSAIGRIKQPRINVVQKDSSALVSSFNKRIAVLEKLLRQQKTNKPKTIIKEKTVIRTDNRKLRVIEKNTNELVKSFDAKLRGGMRVVPSPS